LYENAFELKSKEEFPTNDEIALRKRKFDLVFIGCNDFIKETPLLKSLKEDNVDV